MVPSGHLASNTLNGRRSFSQHDGCLNPELEVPWPFEGCSDVGNESVLGTSALRNIACGLCSNQRGFARDFSRFSQKLKADLHPRCSELIVFGVAFGEQYLEDVMKEYDGQSEDYFQCSIIAFLQSHGHLVFDRRNDIHIPVPGSILPFKSMRRNTKLFKMHVHLLFPWEKRILWRDAKLKHRLADFVTS